MRELGACKLAACVDHVDVGLRCVAGLRDAPQATLAVPWAWGAARLWSNGWRAGYGRGVESLGDAQIVRQFRNSPRAFPPPLPVHVVALIRAVQAGLGGAGRHFGRRSQAKRGFRIVGILDRGIIRVGESKLHVLALAELLRRGGALVRLCGIVAADSLGLGGLTMHHTRSSGWLAVQRQTLLLPHACGRSRDYVSAGFQ